MPGCRVVPSGAGLPGWCRVVPGWGAGLPGPGLYAPRPLQMASPHALPHAHRADRLIEKKTQGKRNLPDIEAVTKWRIIETLARATPEEIVEFAFALCAP